MEWIDRMQRSIEPARRAADAASGTGTGRSAARTGSPPSGCSTYASRLRGYADLGAEPDASVPRPRLRHDDEGRRDVVLPQRHRRTPRDRPNENYAREFMELFCLGVFDAAGQRELHARRTSSSSRARSPAGASTGSPRRDRRAGVASSRAASTPGSRPIFGQTRGGSRPTTPWTRSSPTPPTRRSSCGGCGREFIAAAARDATLDGARRRLHGRRAYKLKPLLRGILSAPGDLRVARRAEHDQAAGRLHGRHAARARRPLKWYWSPRGARATCSSACTARPTSRAGRAGCRG